ncbi:MAG: glycosyltransferase, exosortase A system-associated [Neomegalonema sp.]|nr:glycosyltransferase, exosortase A system-associated [Neomegalonema sp.]
MRVLHILDHSIPLHSGYTFRTLGLLRALSKAGIDCVCMTTPKHGEGLPGQGQADAAAMEELEGYRFYRTPAPAMTRQPLKEIAQMRATARRLAEVVAQEKPDLIHAHSPVLNAIPAIWQRRRNRLPLVYEIRAFWEDAAVDLGSTSEGSLRYRATQRMEEWAAERADAVFPICAGIRDDLIGRGISKDKFTLVPNAVEIERFPALTLEDRDPELARELGLEGARVIGFLGSFYAYEGLDLLIEALPALRARDPRFKLLLVGGGPEEARLKQMATAHGDAVVFTGRVPHAQVRRYYALMDAQALPRKSIRLTELVTPLKPLEAMALRIPVVASDIGGHREQIADGETGWLADPTNPDSFAAALEAASSIGPERERRLSNARRFVEQERQWDHYAQRAIPIYRRLVGADIPVLTA